MSVSGTKKIGKISSRNKIKGLLIKAEFISFDTTNSATQKILGTYAGNDYLINTDTNIEFGVKVNSHFYNVTSNWSTGTWTVDLQKRTQAGVQNVIGGYNLVESLNCDAGKVVNEKYWNFLALNEGEGGANFAVESRLKDVNSPTFNSNCEPDFYRTTALIYFPNFTSLEQIRAINESVSYLESFKVVI